MRAAQTLIVDKHAALFEPLHHLRNSGRAVMTELAVAGWFSSHMKGQSHE